MSGITVTPYVNGQPDPTKSVSEAPLTKLNKTDFTHDTKAQFGSGTYQVLIKVKFKPTPTDPARDCELIGTCVAP